MLRFHMHSHFLLAAPLCLAIGAAAWASASVDSTGVDPRGPHAPPSATGAALPDAPGAPAAALIDASGDVYRFDMPATQVRAATSSSDCDEVGYIEPATPDVQAALGGLPWTRAPYGEGATLRLELASPGAAGLRLELTDMQGLELRVYDPASGVVFGPVHTPRLDENGRWWTTVVFGNVLGLELYDPGKGAAAARIPEITSVAYLYRGVGGDRGQPPTGSCDPDVTCDAGWNNSVEERSVGYMLFNCTPTNCGQCTGALLNRSPSDLPTGFVSPTFMTARHCIGTQAEANSLIVIWGFKTPTCDGVAPNPNTLPRNDGSLLLKTTFASEWSLLGLYQRDLGGNYSGWNAGFLANGSAVTSINHGDGQPKRIATGTKTGETNCLGATNEWTMVYTFGRTIPGASGSPVFDANRQVRGTLSCDNRDCPPTQVSNYGRFDTAFAIVGYYLFNMPSATFANRAVAGDPGNDGTAERGTALNPFNTVYEATFCVPTNGSVQIAPGSYNERFTLWRPMRLVNNGGGTVVIGAP